MTTERITCHRCHGAGVMKGLAGKPLHRCSWYCDKCGGTGVLIFDDRTVVATGVQRKPVPEGYPLLDNAR